MKVNINILREKKIKKEPVSWVTAYDYPTSKVAEKSGIDMILVGDSGGMVTLGYKSTNPVTMDEMIGFAKAARRGAPDTFIVGDMPQGSYETDKKSAIQNSLRFIKEAESDAIKCEGGIRIADKVKAMTDAGIMVVGHLGLTPQSSSNFGGYKVQGKDTESLERIIQDALALQDAGISFLLLEAMPTEPAKIVAEELKVPVYGIGTGNQVDGQLLIMHDLLGFYPDFRPKFAKCYIPEVIDEFISFLKTNSENSKLQKNCEDGLMTLSEFALKRYIKEVKARSFPSNAYTYGNPENIKFDRTIITKAVKNITTNLNP